jgi:hypothetical protein
MTIYYIELLSQVFAFSLIAGVLILDCVRVHRQQLSVVTACVVCGGDVSPHKLACGKCPRIEGFISE